MQPPVHQILSAHLTCAPYNMSNLNLNLADTAGLRRVPHALQHSSADFCTGRGGGRAECQKAHWRVPQKECKDVQGAAKNGCSELSAGARRRSGERYIMTRKRAKAERKFKKCISLNPKNALYHNELGF